MTLLAIDPGLNNGFAVVTDGGELLIASEFPVAGLKANKRLMLAGLADMIGQFQITRAVMEDVGAMPKQGVMSTFRFGRAAGQVEGALMALKIPLQFVRPSVWKRAYGVGADKDNMRALAMQRWPHHQDRFKLVKDQHRAEAAMLGLYHLGKHRGA